MRSSSSARPSTPSSARRRAARSTTSATSENRLKVHFADLTDRTSVDYLVRELQGDDRRSAVRLPPRRAGARRRVVAPPVRDGRGERRSGRSTCCSRWSTTALELEKFDTAGTSEEYGNVSADVAHHHDFDDEGGLILHERSPINPKSIYATVEGGGRLPDDELPRRVRRPGRRHADVQQLRPPPEPALRHRHDHHAGARTRHDRARARSIPLRDFCFCTDGVRGHLTVAAQGKPGDVYVYGQGENVSMRDWAEMILRIGAENGYWPEERQISSVPARFRPGAERRPRAPRRPREAHRGDGLAAEGVVGGRDPAARSAGTPRTATAGSAAWTGCRPALHSGPRSR